MSKFLPQKRLLVQKVFDKASSETTETSFSGILKDLEISLKEDHKIFLSYKTFENYYKTIVEKNEDYKIKPEILDFLSKYLGFENFDGFCENEDFGTNIFEENKHGSNSLLEEILKTLLGIKENLSFVLSHIMMKQSSFGILGVLLLGGFILNKSGYFQKNEKIEDRKQGFVPEILIRNENPNISSAQQTIVYVPQSEKLRNSGNYIVSERKKECMYWKNDHYEPVFCDEKSTENVIALNEDQLLMKKINLPDTLNEENALGKVWYNKNNHKVEFFTHYGIHPTNGKTLKPVTKYILETYIKQ